MDIVKYLTTEIDNTLRCDPNCTNNDGMSCLHIASKWGKLDIIKYLVTEENCDPNRISDDGKTCLHYACELGQLDLVKYLFEQHQCTSKRDKEGNTPLHYTIEGYDHDQLDDHFNCIVI